MATRGPILAGLISAFCCIGLAQGATARDLYTRLGGSSTVNAFVAEALERSGIPADAKQPLAEHICALAGSGGRDTRAPRLSDAQFIRLIDALRAAMRAHDVPLAARNEFLEAIAPLRNPA